MYLLRESEIKRLIMGVAGRRKVGDTHKFLSRDSVNLWNSLEDHHKEELTEYTTDSSSLNRDLFRHNGKVTKILSVITQRRIRHIDEVMKKSRISDDVVVHSGVRWHPGVFLKERHIRNPDKNPIRVRLPAFTSTSLSKKKATEFASVEQQMRTHNSESLDLFNTRVRGGKTYTHPVTGKKVTLSAEHTIRHSEIASRVLKHSDSMEKHVADKEKLIDEIHAEHGLEPLQNSGVKQYAFQHISDHGAYQHIISIHVPRNSNAYYAAPRSRFKNEKEMILPRNTKLHIHPIPDIDHKSQVVTWHARVVT